MTTRLHTAPISLSRGAVRTQWSLVRNIRDLLALHRQRQALNDLDPRLLDDIGVSRDAAEAEARRAPWDVPSTWRA